MSGGWRERVAGILRASYRALLITYPRGFRERVADDMSDVFRDLCEAELRAGRASGLALLGLHTIKDVTRNGLAERFRSAPGRPASRSTPATGGRNGPRPSKGDRYMHAMSRDVRLAVRTLLKQPVFSLGVIFVLALGIAGTTGIFSVFNGLFLRPLPFEQPDRLVNVDETAPQWNLEFVSVNYNDALAWSEQNRTFEAIAVFDDESINMSLDGEPSRVDAALVSESIFDVLRIEPSIGRRFTAEEDLPGAAGVVLLGNALWRDRFGSDPAVVGRALMLDSVPYTVIGILPPEAVFVDGDLWVPLRADPAENQGSWWLSGIGRLRPGVTIEQAREDLGRVHTGMREERPVNEVTSPVVIPVLERILGDFRLGTVALLGAVSIVLLIACANVAGLMLARSTSLTREVGVRVALGAGRWRILQQVLTESLILAAGGALLGVGLGFLAMRAALAAAPQGIPRWISFDLDVRFLLFTTSITAGAALLFGLAPALRAARTDPQRVLQAAGRTTHDSAGRRWLNALVVVEIALALVLLIGAGLFMTAFQRLQNVDPGFIPENVLSYSLALPANTYDDDAKQLAFFRRHLAEMRALPGVTDVGAATARPLGGHTGSFFEAENAPPPADNAPNPVTLTRWATAGYFRAIGVSLIAGRLFDAADGEEEAPPVVIVNESFAQHHWPDQDPIGKRITSGGDDPEWITVVGLTRDVKHYGLDQDMRPGVYFPYARSPRSSMTIVARAAVDPLSLIDEARELVRRRDPELPIYGVTTMSQALRESLWARRASSWTFMIFATVALLLAVSGIYGVVSYGVGQRRREIGVRMALGAQQAQVLGAIMRHGIRLVGTGVVLGLAATLLAARALSALLFGVSATDPLVYAAVTLVLVTVALLANLVPARRAASIDPMLALRDE